MALNCECSPSCEWDATSASTFQQAEPSNSFAWDTNVSCNTFFSCL
jgi:hypothetical protein